MGLKIKRKIISLFAPYFYPQSVFAKEIKSYLDPVHKRVLIDCPCGNGETSYNLSGMKNLDVAGYDLSSSSINIAKAWFKRPNLSYHVEDIHNTLQKSSSFYYFTLINSLFLLPDQDTILKTIFKKLDDEGLLFVIVPNTKGENFRIFNQNLAHTGINTLELSEKEFEPYFSKFGFKIQSVKAIVYAHNYGRWELKLMSVFSHFYLLLLHKIKSLNKKTSGNYYLIVLSK